MSIHIKEWVKLNLFKGRDRPAASVVLPGQLIEEAIARSGIAGTDISQESLFIRRIAFTSREKRAKIIIEIARREDIKRWADG